MQYYRNPYLMLKSVDSKWAPVLASALITLKYMEVLPPYADEVLYRALGQSALGGLRKVGVVSLQEIALEGLQNTALHYKNEFENYRNKADRDDRVTQAWWAGCESAADMTVEYLHSCRSFPKSETNKLIADSYLYTITNKLLAFSVLNYYSRYAPSAFIGILAVGGVEFALEMAQAICYRDQYINKNSQDYDYNINRLYVLQSCLCKALGSAAVKICIATVACDQKHLVSQIIVLPQLYFIIEPLANFFVNSITSQAKLVDMPKIVLLD